MRCPHIRCDKISYHVRVFPCACALPAHTRAGEPRSVPRRPPRVAAPARGWGEGRGGATTRPPSAGDLSGREEGRQGGGGETHVGGGDWSTTTPHCSVLRLRVQTIFCAPWRSVADTSSNRAHAPLLRAHARPRALGRVACDGCCRAGLFFWCRAWPCRCACCRHVQPAPFALLAHAARSTSAFQPPQTFEHADTTASLGISRARVRAAAAAAAVALARRAENGAEEKKLPRACARCSHARHAGKQDQTLQQTRHDRGARCHNARTDSNESHEGGGIEDERMAA